MPTRVVEGKKPYTGGKAITVDENKVISLNLRDENNLIIYDEGDDEIYVDLQLPNELRPTDAFPVGVTTGRTVVDNGWDLAGTILCAKTTSGDNIKLLYADNGTLWIDNGTGTFKQIYFKGDVDAIVAALQSQIDAIMGLGKFLSIWDCTTGLPDSFPLEIPYEYSTGDWYLVGVVDSTTNYRPNGSSFTGVASQTVETELPDVNDVYIYDGTNWMLQRNSGLGGGVSFAQITGQPTDNTNLATALGAKADSSSLATVATSGEYSDLLNKPSLATVATTGDYDDLLNKPTIPAAQVQSDWTQADNSKVDYIKNKPNLATVATSGDYTDLTNKPTIPAAQVNSDWNASSGVAEILNKPTIPTDTSDLTNSAGFITGITSTDVTTALGYTPYDSANPSGYITGITSSDVTTALGYTPYNSSNPSGYTSNTGDVVGPSSAVDGNVAVFDQTTGKLIKDGNMALSTLSAGASAGATAVQPGDLGTAAACDTGTSSGNVPVLDSNGKLATTILPGVALTDTFTVTNASDLTSLTTAEQGDIGIVTSESKTYVLSAEPYSTAANWKELLSPTDAVTSVNSMTGAVTLDADDISDSTTTNKFVTANEKSTWGGKQDALTLPSSPTQGNLVTWGANNKTLVDGGAIPTVPTDVSSFNNDAGYITGITSSDVTTALGYTPYSNANPSGYTSNTGDVVGPSSSIDGDIALFDGATGKLIKDSGIGLPEIAKVFYLPNDLTSASAISIAQDAYDWFDAGKTPIVVYKGKTCTVAYSTSATLGFRNSRTLMDSSTYSSGGYTAINQYEILFAISSGTVTSITKSEPETYFIDPTVTYTNPFTPTQNCNPATKKYADDKVSDTAYAASWNGDTTTAPSKNAVYDKIESINQFSPGGTATTGYVVTKTAGGYEWAAPTGGNGIAKIFSMPSVNSNISDIVYWIYSSAGSAILKENLGTGLSQDFVYYDVTEHNYDLQYLIAVSTVGGITTQKKINYTVSSHVYTCSTIETTTSGGDVVVSSQTGNILTSGTKLWAGLESDYQNLGSYDSNTIYLCI